MNSYRIFRLIEKCPVRSQPFSHHCSALLQHLRRPAGRSPFRDWMILRGQTPAKFPVIWDPNPDSSEGRVVVTVDFKTDLFAPAPMTGPQFTNEWLRMESAIVRLTGHTNFLLPGKSEKVRCYRFVRPHPALSPGERSPCISF
jgi:hypothetical protein